MRCFVYREMFCPDLPGDREEWFMKYVMEPDYESLSRRVCNILMDTVRADPQAAIVLPTGSSPLGAYRLFVQSARREGLCLEQVTWIQLDEWGGLGADNPSSCGYFIRREILEPLSIKESRFIAFRGEAPDPAKECERVSRQIQGIGRISLVMLGIGKNGHIGLNEPGDVWHMPVHPTELSTKSMTHSMLTQEAVKPVYGLTIGMEIFFQADKVVLIVTGAEKEEAVSCLFQDVISPRCPATILKLHTNAVCVMEERLYREAGKGKAV